jgi:LysM repeat protein
MRKWLPVIFVLTILGFMGGSVPLFAEGAANELTVINPLYDDVNVQAVKQNSSVEVPLPRVIAADAVPASSSEDSGGTYAVVPGDSLWAIARRLLGDGSRYWDIVEANKTRFPSIAKNPDLIYPGWELVIPGVSVPKTPIASDQEPKPDSSETVPVISAPATGAKGGKALAGWLQAAGLTGENLKTAWAIGMAESGGNPRAYNGNSKTGDKSYGLFQINMLGKLGPARLKQYNLKSNEDLFDPVTNIRVMIKMSRNFTNWQPWSVFKRGTYKKFLSQYPPK